MTASELIANLEQARILDEKTLERLRRQVEERGPDVKPRAIVKLLLERGLISEQQSEDLLAGKPLVPQLLADEQFEVAAPARKEQDTDDLTNVLGHLSQKEPPAKSKAAAKPSVPASPEPAVVSPASRESGRSEKRKSERGAGDDRETRIMDPLEAEEVEAAAKKRSGGKDEGAREPGPKQDFRDGEPRRGKERKDRKRPERDDDLASPFEADPASSSELAGPATPRKSYAGKLDTADQWNTRWLWTGFGILAALLVAAAVLWLGVLRVDADKLMGEAETSYSNEAYGDAADKFDEFFKKFPGHDKANFAQLRAVNAKIRLPYNTRDYNAAYNVAIVQLPSITENPLMNDELRPDLAVMLPTIAKWFSENAVKQKEVPLVKEKLEVARKVYGDLIESPLYLTNSQKNSPRNSELLASVENDLLTAEGILKKEDDYVQVRSKITTLTEEGKTDLAFAEFTKLVRTYPDLGARAELREAMAAVSQREVGLVTAIQPTIPVTAGALPSPVVRQLLTGSTVGTPVESMRGEVLPVLAEGAVYGVDAGSGALLWRHFVGLSTTIQPQWLNDDDRRSLLVCDQQRHLILHVDATSGQILWTTEIGESFTAPRIGAEAAFIATNSGKVLKLGLADGQLQKAVQLPRKISVACEIADQDPILFVLGDDANLYILSTEDLTCSSVFYLGHFPGAVEIAPQYWSGHLLLAVNGSDFSDLVVLRPAESGADWQRLQQIRLAEGRVVSEPSQLGRMMLFTSLKGDIRILDINPSEPENPIRISSEEKFEARSGIRTWALASGGDMWIAGRGIMRYRIQRATGLLERETVANGADIYLGPLVKRDDVLFETRKRDGSRLVSVSAINAQTLEKIWRTDFGGPLAGTPIAAGNGVALVNSLGNLMYAEPGNANGSPVLERSKASDIDEVFAFQSQSVLADGSVVCHGATGQKLILSVSAGGEKAAIRSLQSPAERVAAQPLAIGNDVVIPTFDGQLVRIDPATGQMAGSPFLPPLSPGQEIKWNAPARVRDDWFVVGNGLNAVLLMDASNRASLEKADELALDGQLRSPVLSLGDRAFVIEEIASGFRLAGLATGSGKLEKTGEFPLGGSAVQDPVTSGELILVHTDDGQLTAVNGDLQKVWSAGIGDSRIAAALPGPNGETRVCMESGTVLAISAGGEVRELLNLGQPVLGAPLLLGQQLLFSTSDGALLVVDGAAN